MQDKCQHACAAAAIFTISDRLLGDYDILINDNQWVRARVVLKAITASIRRPPWRSFVHLM